MVSKIAKTILFAAAFALVSLPAFAQTGSLSGKVTDENGQPLKDAVIKIERLDVKGSYSVKTKKKGDWFHAGLPLGSYAVALEVEGRELDRVSGVRVGAGSGEPVNFDMAEIKQRQQAAQASGGQATKEQIASMSPEQRKQYEEDLKKRQQQLTKNKELNEAFNAGMEAKRLNDFPTAITHLSKAAELDPEQDVVWANLADSQSSLGDAVRGEERTKVLTDAIGSYEKAIALKPDAAAYYNNMGLAMIKNGQTEEGKAKLAQAAQLDPTNAGKYWFNLGAVLVNSGNMDGAIDAFRSATEAQPDFANAFYQLGTSLVGKAQTKDDGSIVPVPGTVEAFEKYLELEPAGAMADGAKMMIQTLTGTVETSFENPDAKKKKK